MIEVETQTIEVEVVTNTEVTSTGQVEVETVDLSDLDITVAKKEYVITGDDIYIPMLYDDAPQWMKDLVQVVVDVSISGGNQSLINSMNAILQDFAVSYVPLNQYTQSIIDLGDEDTRLNGLIETLNSNFNDGLSTANAQITSLQLTKASKDEVVAQVIQTIAAQLADGTSNIGSTIGRIDQAIANETSARATSLQTLTASLEDTNLNVTANAEVIQNALAYVGIDEAGASTGTGLSAYLEDSNGNIGGADSQLANSIRVTAEGVESKFAYNSLLNINGVYKRSGFGLTTNYVSGSGTEVDPYVSEFWIDASRLKFTNSNVTGSVAPFTIDASGVTPKIAFNGVVNFSNVNNIQNSGSNLLYNSAPKIGYETKGWSIGWSNHGLSSDISAGFDLWKPTGGASVCIHVYGSPAVGSVFDINNSSFPVVAGNKYEASAYISSHRCTSYVTIAWYNSSGAYISESSGTVVNLASGGSLSGWARSELIVTAPTGAVKGLFYVRSNVTSSDPYCFVSYAFAGKVLSNQTVVSDWSEGTSVSISSGDVVTDINAGNTTTINGGKITTNSITANQIQANSVSADRLMAGTNGSTVWTGGGLVSSNFNGNPVGVIGSPTSGFRLSSNSAGNSSDPNIYGAYIRGSTIAASALAVDSLKIETAVNTFAPLSFASVASVQNQITSDYSLYLDTIFSPVYSGGYYNKRVSSYQTPINLFMNCFIDVGDVTCLFEVSYNGGGWVTVDTRTQNGNGNSGFTWSTIYVPEASWSYLQIRFRFAGSYMRSASCNYLVINGS